MLFGKLKKKEEVQFSSHAILKPMKIEDTHVS